MKRQTGGLSAPCFREARAASGFHRGFTKRTEEGFSLVEIVLALGVAAFAVIGIFAMTQTGLISFRESQNASAGVSIGQQVLSRYLLGNYETIATSPPATNFYDVRGIETGPEGATFRSIAEISPANGLGSGPENLLRLRVEVTSPTQPNWRRVFVSFIARQGEDAP